MGIEIASPFSKSNKENGVAPPPPFQLEPCGANLEKKPDQEADSRLKGGAHVSRTCASTTGNAALFFASRKEKRLHAVDENGQIHIATKSDLDNLKVGKEFVFIVSLITYKDPKSDSKTEHHLPLCLFLQPPATPPAIWHYCDVGGFNRSE